MLGVVALIAAASVSVSIELHRYAGERRAIDHQLAQIEINGTAQAGIVWRALTMLMAEEQMSFVRLRGEEQRGRGAILSRLDELATLETAGNTWTTRLGFTTDPSAPPSLETLESRTSTFLAGVQGTIAQMSLNHSRVRDRLRYWDMNFGQFQESLAEVRTRNDEISAAATLLAGRVTAAAALITLMAAAMLVLQLGRVRTRRERDLQMERIRTVAAREAHFRELVQHASDLILVLDSRGHVTYASPSVTTILGRTPDRFDELTTQPVDEFLACGTRDLLITADVENAGDMARRYRVQTRDLRGDTTVNGFVLTAHDVTEQRQLESQLRHQATHDPLTNLPNRRAFRDRFDILESDAMDDTAVLFVDLDGFKRVNDSYGHAAGDQLLVRAASRLRGCLAPQDLLARQGGDEFIILLRGNGTKTAESIQAALAPPFTLDGHEVFISASIGIADDVGSLSSEEAAQRADIAMYAAKEAGRACAKMFSDDMLHLAPERLALETDFRRALERNEFTVVYQPKVGLASGRMESLEALVRWEHPTRGIVGPDVFIPFAEETGLISELGRIVLEQACADAIRWQDRGVVVAVNLSPVQFRNPCLIDEVRHALTSTGLDPKHLELEITESAVLGDVTETIRVLDELKTLGVRLAIDDFGTGYSNLAHLKHFNVDVLKIDQAFVRGGDPTSLDQLSDGAIVEAVIGMAKAFGMHVVAEGVETVCHADELRELGADLGQGYFFSRPVTGDGIDEFLTGEQSIGRDFRAA